MDSSRIVPPIDFLRVASRSSLQSFELARLNHAANLRREIAALIDQWIQETSEAMLARWMLEHFGSLRQPAPSTEELLGTFLGSQRDLLPALPNPVATIDPATPKFAEPRQRLTGTLGGKRPK